MKYAHLCIILTVALASQAQAEERLDTASAESIRAAAGSIVENLTQNLIRDPVCPIHLAIEPQGVRAMGKGGVELLHDAVETAFAATTFGASCSFIEHDLTAADAAAPNLDELAPQLDQQGSLMIMSFIPSPDDVIVLAKMKRTDGDILSYSGPVEMVLQAVDAGDEAAIASDAAEPEPLEIEPVETEAAETEVVEPEPVETEAAEAPRVAPAPSASADDSLRIYGSAAIADHLMPKLAAAFLRSQVGAPGNAGIDVATETTSEGDRVLRLVGQPAAALQSIQIRPNGENQGFDDLLTDDAHIVMAQRAVTEAEDETFRNRHDVDMRSREAEFVIGFDLLQFFVPPNNRLPGVSRAVLADIYSRDLEQWSVTPIAASGLNGRINAIGPGAGYRVMEVLRERIMGNRYPTYQSSLDSGAAVADLVARDPYAVGFGGLAVDGDMRTLEIEECGLTYAPDIFAIRTEDHPLSLRLYLYANPAASLPARDDFLAFVMSDEAGAGQDIIGEDFVNLEHTVSGEAYSVKRWRDISQQEPVINERQALLLRSISSARRASTTFRFRFDSDRITLDSRSERDLERLVSDFKAQGIRSEQVMLLGFADNVGEAGYNLALSERRAQAVADLLAASGFEVARDGVIAIGEDAPIACAVQADGEPDERGLSRNRRVEVWLK